MMLSRMIRTTFSQGCPPKAPKTFRWATFGSAAVVLTVLARNVLGRQGLEATFVSNSAGLRTFPRLPLEVGFSSGGFALDAAEPVAPKGITSQATGACGFALAVAMCCGFLGSAAASRAAKLSRRAIADR